MKNNLRRNLILGIMAASLGAPMTVFADTAGADANSTTASGTTTPAAGTSNGTSATSSTPAHHHHHHHKASSTSSTTTPQTSQPGTVTGNDAAVTPTNVGSPGSSVPTPGSNAAPGTPSANSPTNP